MAGPQPSAVVLFAHGSRDARWREPVEAVARRMGELQPGVAVACAYLELVEPDLPTAAARLIADGARSLRVVPLFLGMGKHVREDLPQLLDALRSAHPEVAFSLVPAVGETAEVIDLLARVALRN
ncbi:MULTISPECIES: CbiX/SirB N-terminal domain-containing protein [unclassified Variovorax]|uniref:sirohydrochlorin chelatase n=1 Tax=unclassified Variovorax TaxID=663243 RepID=UPI002574DDB2|nr:MULTISPECIES: CbiX/SirB N-terminal domain-containing protein [unclassified Variovorax]MDM0086314.1 CbiX/SirB N-terminal domain-containing protein [Variovorax sp. J22G40]MDM0145429.1 CbiX/SirB N-terminal domain-containing protein [Variovorax sp. J2P1-31]